MATRVPQEAPYSITVRHPGMPDRIFDPVDIEDEVTWEGLMSSMLADMGLGSADPAKTTVTLGNPTEKKSSILRTNASNLRKLFSKGSRTGQISSQLGTTVGLSIVEPETSQPTSVSEAKSNASRATKEDKLPSNYEAGQDLALRWCSVFREVVASVPRDEDTSDTTDALLASGHDGIFLLEKHVRGKKSITALIQQVRHIQLPDRVGLCITDNTTVTPRDDCNQLDYSTERAASWNGPKPAHPT